jgi:ABC-2 type transport system permease protein
MASYLKLEILRVLRNRRYRILALAVPVGFYLLFGKLMNTGAGDIGGTKVQAYFMVSMAAYSALLAVVFIGGSRLAAERLGGWTRLLRVTPLPAWGYMTTKVLASFVLALPSILLVSATAAIAGPVRLGAGQWIQLVLLLWIGTLPFAALGILLGYLFDPDTAQPASIVTILLLAMLGGLFIPTIAMPETMRQIAHALPSYHLADLGWRAIAGQSVRIVDLLILAAYGAAFGVLVMWRYRRDEATV